MRFASEVPIEAMAARPWAVPAIISPPPGMDDRVGSLMVQVDERTPLGRGFRFFVEVDETDLEALSGGGLIEFVIYGDRLCPVSVSLLP